MWLILMDVGTSGSFDSFKNRRFTPYKALPSLIGTKYGRFTTIYISKYEHFTRKIKKNLLISWVSVVVSGDFCCFKLAFHHFYSCQKTKLRLHTPISTVVHAEVVCAPKILPFGIFLRFSKITAP